MEELRKFFAPEFIYGDDARLLIGRYIINMGVEKILIATDPSFKQYEWYRSILEAFKEEGIDYVIYDNITVNPKDHECHGGVKVYEESDCDAIVAIGGGSVIDCAKGIGILVANDGSIRDYEGIDEIPRPVPALICIPTTSGSSADISQFAIITNTETLSKMAIVSKMIVPDIALIDPVTTLTKPLDLTLDTGLDVLCHAIESYVSNGSSFITEIHALESIKGIVKYLPLLANNLDDLFLRSEVMKASVGAGLSFSNASLGLVHGVAHALGGYYNMIHGELNGILLEHVIEYNYESAEDKYRQIEEIFVKAGYDEKDKLWQQVHKFVEKVRVNRGIEEQGADRKDWDVVASHILNDPCLATNPRLVTKEDVVMILEKIF